MRLKTVATILLLGVSLACSNALMAKRNLSTCNRDAGMTPKTCGLDQRQKCTGFMEEGGRYYNCRAAHGVDSKRCVKGSECKKP